jgi:diacylglycerol kinase family enzyme
MSAKVGDKKSRIYSMRKEYVIGGSPRLVKLNCFEFELRSKNNVAYGDFDHIGVFEKGFFMGFGQILHDMNSKKEALSYHG